MVKLLDFFKGIDEKRAKEIIKNVITPEPYRVRIEEEDKIIKASTELFRKMNKLDLQEFEDFDNTHKVIINWIAGLNTRDFLEAMDRD